MTKIKSRRCVACNEYHNGREMLRVIKNSEGIISYDKAGNQNGRGAYVCMNANCLEKAIKTGAFNKSLHAEVPRSVIADLMEDLKTIEK